MKDFTIRQINGLQFIVCDPIERLGFKNAFSTRSGGVSPFPENSLSLGNFKQDQPANVIENRKRFLDALQAGDWHLVTAKQVHSADIRYLRDREDARGEPQTCDALTSNIERILLSVQVADCLPILIADERTKAFAAVHAGWRGTLAGIVARTISEMQHRYGSNAGDLHIAIGPGISAEFFEVGPEVIESFNKEYSYAHELVSINNHTGKARLNINRANIRQSIDAGVSPEKIYDSGLCTYSKNDLFFSYRRERGSERPVGRLMGVIGRNGQ